jgi:hypothetical protein
MTPKRKIRQVGLGESIEGPRAAMRHYTYRRIQWLLNPSSSDFGPLPPSRRHSDAYTRWS